MSEIFSRILFPFTKDQFLNQYQAREYFHVSRTTPGYYADLLSVSEIDSFLQSGHLPAASINVVQNGLQCPLEAWSRVDTSARGSQRVADPEMLLSLYSRGATLILNQAHRAMPKLIDACRILTQELGFPTNANIYITPRNSAGFVEHADDHEVLVLQIAGNKSWTVYPTDRLPTEFKLLSGDLLYLPRGTVHAAKSGDEDSVHITLGLNPAYGFELIRNIASLAAEMTRFQLPEPPLFAGAGAMASFESDFLISLQTLLAELKPSALSSIRHEALVVNQSQGWRGRFSDLRLVHLMTPNTVVCRRPEILVEVKRDGNFLDIEFAGRQVTVPIFIQNELDLILGKSSFSVHKIGGMVTTAGKIRLVTEFVTAGLLQIVTI